MGFASAFPSLASNPSCCSNHGVATLLSEKAEDARKCLLEHNFVCMRYDIGCELQSM